MKVLIVLGVVVLLTGGGLAVMNNACKSSPRAWCGSMSRTSGKLCCWSAPASAIDRYSAVRHRVEANSAPYTAARCQSRTDPMPQDRRPELFLPLIP